MWRHLLGRVSLSPGGFHVTVIDGLASLHAVDELHELVRNPSVLIQPFLQLLRNFRVRLLRF